MLSLKVFYYNFLLEKAFRKYLMHQKHTGPVLIFHISVLVTNPKLGGNKALEKNCLAGDGEAATSLWVHSTFSKTIHLPFTCMKCIFTSSPTVFSFYYQTRYSFLSISRGRVKDASALKVEVKVNLQK